MSSETELSRQIFSPKEKMLLIANQCIGLSVQRYSPGSNDVFRNENFNGCLAFVRFVLTGAGIPIPNFIGPDRVVHQMTHVNEFFDHFGVNIPHGKQQLGDLVFFSWDGFRPLHIGIVVDGETYIHAHTKSGLVRKNILKDHQIKTDISEPLYLMNPIGFKRPTLSNNDPRWFQKLII